MGTIKSKTILFVTGAFVSNRCWDDWKEFFESRGYAASAPPWLSKDAPAAVLRSRHPDPAIASLRLSQLIEYFAGIAQRFSEKPIIIGHSTGGLIAQLLLQRGLAAAGVAIHSLPPRGVIPYQFSFWRAAGKSLGFFTSTKETYLMSLKDWQYAFTNGMPLEQQKASYDRFVTPESKLLARDAITKIARVDFSKPHAPLLFIAGSTDTIIPASLNRSNFKRYRDRGSVTDYKEFAGRNHFVLGLPTWKEDADYILNWIDAHREAPAVPEEKKHPAATARA